MKHILILFFVASLCSVQSQNYSIKNRQNVKLSLSFNRTNESNDPLFQPFEYAHPLHARLNMRAEYNYGVLNWLEIGGCLGYIRFKNDGYRKKIFLAPDAGININVHLLPFWVKNEDCRWEFYLTAKYGGAYLINYESDWYGVFDVVTFGYDAYGKPDTTYFRAQDSYGLYRHTFGIGVGGGVYFKNVFGLYAEVMAGQFSYFPKLAKCYYTARVGIGFKFTSKKYKKQSMQIL